MTKRNKNITNNCPYKTAIVKGIPSKLSTPHKENNLLSPKVSQFMRKENLFFPNVKPKELLKRERKTLNNWNLPSSLKELETKDLDMRVSSVEYEPKEIQNWDMLSSTKEYETKTLKNWDLLFSKQEFNVQDTPTSVFQFASFMSDNETQVAFPPFDETLTSQ